MSLKVGHQLSAELVSSSSRRRRSRSRGRRYLRSSSATRVGGGIGLLSLRTRPPLVHLRFAPDVGLRGIAFITSVRPSPADALLLSAPETDVAHLEAGGDAAGSAARKETVSRAFRTRTNAQDSIGAQSRAFELTANNRPQAHEGLAGAPCPRMFTRLRDFCREAIGKPGLDFEATSANRRAHRGSDVFGPRAHRDHRMHALAGDSGERAAPSGVQCGRDMMLRIDHEDRNAIAGEDPEHDPGFARDHPVAFDASAIVMRTDRVNDVAMHLLESRDRAKIGIELPPATPVFFDCSWIIADPSREVHRRVDAAAHPPSRPMKPCES